MQLKLQTIVLPVIRSATAIGDALNAEALAGERMMTAAAVAFGVLVVAGFALLMSMV